MLLSQRNNGTEHYFLQDAQRSTIAMADVSGTVTSSYSYSAFGELPDSSNLETNYLYTGQQYDSATELYSLRARYYNPADGRFLTRDTWAYNYSNPVELNRYTYAQNNPATYTDPSGYVALAERRLLELDDQVTEEQFLLMKTAEAEKGAKVLQVVPKIKEANALHAVQQTQTSPLMRAAIGAELLAILKLLAQYLLEAQTSGTIVGAVTMPLVYAMMLTNPNLQMVYQLMYQLQPELKGNPQGNSQQHQDNDDDDDKNSKDYRIILGESDTLYDFQDTIERATKADSVTWWQQWDEPMLFPDGRPLHQRGLKFPQAFFIAARDPRVTTIHFNLEDILDNYDIYAYIVENYPRNSSGECDYRETASDDWSITAWEL